eukprot:1194727-Prorocentrum_minimum.AAC.4
MPPRRFDISDKERRIKAGGQRSQSLGFTTRNSPVQIQCRWSYEAWVTHSSSAVNPRTALSMASILGYAWAQYNFHAEHSPVRTKVRSCDRLRLFVKAKAVRLQFQSWNFARLGNVIASKILDTFVLIQALTAASLSALSTVLARWLTNEAPGEKPADSSKLPASSSKLFDKLPACLKSPPAKMFLFGLLFAGPSAHYWNLWIEDFFKGAPATAITAAKKVLLDQVTYGPLCNFAAMSFIGLLVEGAVQTCLNLWICLTLKAFASVRHPNPVVL